MTCRISGGGDEIKRLTPPLLLVIIGLTLAGCGGSRSSLALPVRGKLLAELNHAQLRGHGAAFLSPTRLAFLTSGSSNCRAVPAKVAVATPNSIRIQLKNKAPKNGICLTDLVIEPVVVAITPKQINVHRRLTIRLYYPLAKQPLVFTAPPLS